MPPNSLSPHDQLAYLTDGIDTLVPEGELLERIATGSPLRAKLGVDPTAPDVTLGWAVVFERLRRFQECGHTAVLIIGDFTAQVGDPSGKSETRKRLDAAEVGGYVTGVVDTIKELLLPENLEIRPNSEWLGSMDMHAILDLTSQFTISRIMDREDFSNRWEAHEPISMIEFMYPLLQGMDSVAVEADIELGGSDQLFNNLVGRDLQERMGQRGQMVMTVPLLVGTDGTKKMSQSLGNYISVKDTPEEMFGKTMSIPDGLMGQWFSLAAYRPADEVAAIVEGVADGTRHPGETKRELARDIVTRYWGSEAAHAAEAAFNALFRRHEIPEDIDEHQLPDEDPVKLPALMNTAGLVSSNSEGRRMLQQGAVKLDGEKIAEEELPREALAGRVLQVGKRRFARLVG
ncbi:MAG: tyrosine--tRNA ligase [Acidimicrobiia bacterium]|nr:tyrosine--tRNA ligase [Acidimicrobiia bacterium]